MVCSVEQTMLSAKIGSAIMGMKRWCITLRDRSQDISWLLVSNIEVVYEHVNQHQQIQETAHAKVVLSGICLPLP
jgi:hypothetical protein